MEKKAQPELKELKEHLDDIIKTSQVAITVTDNQGNFSFFNQGAEKITGYKAEEVIGKKKISDFYSDPKELEYIQRKLSQDGVIENFEANLLRKDGTCVPISISVSLLKDHEGNSLGSIGFSTEISAKRNAEKALRESVERLNAIINHTPNVAIESYDISGRVLYWNNAAEKLFGWKREEALGKTLDQLILDSKSKEKFCQALKEVDRQNKPISPSEWKCKDKEGREIIVYSTIFPIPSTDGRKEFICMDVDITERRKAEEDLRKSEERYRFLYEKSSTVNLIIGIDGIIKDVNEASLKRFGYSKEDIIGKKALEFVVPEQREKVTLQLEKDFQGEPTAELDVDIIARDGTLRTILFSEGRVLMCEGEQPESILITGIDLTERKKAEEALRENEEKFRNLAEQSPNMIFINKKGKVVYANHRCEEIMGYSRDEFHSPDFNFFTLIAPDCVDLVKSSFNMHMKDEEVAPYEYTLITKEGKKIEAILTTKLITYKGENAFLGIVTDITERKKMEQKIVQANKELEVLNAIASIVNKSLNLDLILKESIDKVLEVTDSQAGGIYLLDETDKELKLKAFKGLSLEAVKAVDKLKLGEGFSGRIAQSGEPMWVEDITQDSRLTRLVMKKEGLHSYLGVPLKSKGKILGTFFVITRDNRVYNPKEVELLLSIGNQIGMAVENAYLFKEAEQWIIHLEAIRNITNRLNKLNDVKTVAFAVMDEIKKVIEFDNCRVFLLSDNKEELLPIAFGSEVEEYKGENEEVLRLKTGEGITGWVAQSGESQLIDDGERHPRSRHVPGSPFVDESIIASPMIYEGEVRGVITLSKLGLKQFKQNHLALLSILANEAAVAIENAKLFESLKQAYAKLKEAQEQLIQSEKLRALGEMAGGVAHDFNNLLGAILGRAQLLLLSAQDEKTKKGLKVIEKAALDGAETVRRIQEFTRVRADEDLTLVDLNEVLKTSLEITRHKWKDDAQKKGVLIQVETSLDKNLPLVAGNPPELREVFVNMILNAVDAMPEGGTISISSQLKEGFIQASISDTGMGMSEEVKRKVFDPFFTTKGPKGNGLGMSVAYGIIVRHNGKILIESQEGKGATFTVKLPKSKMEGKEKLKKKPLEEKKKENILIIDDEPAIRELICDIIQSEGHRAIAVDTSLKGVELFEKEKFDLVFTDLSMPEMSGWEVAEKLKSLNPEVIVVMITGWGVQLEAKKLKAHSVDLLMTKPFEVKKLFEVLRQAQRIKKEKEKKKQEKVTA